MSTGTALVAHSASVGKTRQMTKSTMTMPSALLTVGFLSLWAAALAAPPTFGGT